MDAAVYQIGGNATVLPAGSAPPLRNYQQQAIRWLVSGGDYRFVVLDPGLGKTAIAIRAAYQAKAKSVCVLCPAVARIVWSTELSRWWPAEERPPLLVVQPGQKSRAVPRPGWTVVAYSNLSMTDDPWLVRLTAQHWDLLIIDECQYLKGQSNRTHAVYGRKLAALPGSLAGAADRVWLLSGTPAPNHAGELFPHIRALFPEALPAGVTNVYQFEDRYCNVKDTLWGRRIAGSNRKTLPDLRQRLSPYVLRRRREDVLKDLPAISFYDTPISVDPTKIDDLLFPSDTNDDDLIRRLRTEEMNLAHERRLLGEAKAKPAAAFCEELLSEMPVTSRKLVVFAHHRVVIATLTQELKDWDPVVIDGGTPQRQRERNLHSFLHERMRAHVFIGQIQAAGTAISLTAAHTVVFVETSWVPAENYQAALRVHRLGQANACSVHFLYVPGSLDQRIMGAFRRKASELAQLLDQ